MSRTDDYRIGNSRVLESREVSDGQAIRRRRETLDDLLATEREYL